MFIGTMQAERDKGEGDYGGLEVSLERKSPTPSRPHTGNRKRAARLGLQLSAGWTRKTHCCVSQRDGCEEATEM